MSEALPEQFTGWRVVDPDGNVIASDPSPIVMEQVTEMGEADNGGD